MYNEICVRLAVLKNKVSFNHILSHENSQFYTMVTLQLDYVW